MIKRLCLIGVGLIGGSLALALRQAGYCQSVIGVGRSPENLQDALDLKIIDEASHDPAKAVVGADMVLLAVPVGSIQSVCAQIAGHLDEGAVLTDAGSVKQGVIDQVMAGFGDTAVDFVPAHPIAGTEKSGAKAAFASLFTDHRVIITATEQSSAEGVCRVRKMWQAAGAIVEEMSVQQHDRVLAATSHLPHVLAYGLVESLAQMNDSEEIFRYAAGGFRDFTRIAGSDPAMWRDICVHNRDAILDALAHYQSTLDDLTQAIQTRDGDRLHHLFSHARHVREIHSLRGNPDD